MRIAILLRKKRCRTHSDNTVVKWASLVVSTVLALSSALVHEARAGIEAGQDVPPLVRYTGGQLVPLAARDAVLPLTYAYVLRDDVPVYRYPVDISRGAPPARTLGKGFLWVSLNHPRPVLWEGEPWYWINTNEYVQAQFLKVFEPSSFHGVSVPQRSGHPFAWLILDTRIAPAPGVVPDFNATVLSRYTLVTVYETQKLGEWNWYRIGDDQWVEQRRVGLVTPSPRPPEIGEDERWVEVNLYEQTLMAYEGDRMIYATLISSGVPEFPSEQGLFRIWAKAKFAKMSGGTGKDFYFLEDVPWHIYYHRSFALHGAYWHDNFGFRQSHGCVNLAPKDASWLFDWTLPPSGKSNWTRSTEKNPGTWVWVHE